MKLQWERVENTQLTKESSFVSPVRCPVW